LAAMAHCQKRDVAGRATLTPHGNSEEWPIDLGTLADLRTGGALGRVYIGFEASNQWTHFGFGNPESSQSDLLLTHISHPHPQVSAAHPTTRSLDGHSTLSPRSDVVQLGEVSLESPNFDLSRQDQTTWWDEKSKRQIAVELDGFLIRSMQPPGLTAIPPNPEIQGVIQRLLSTLTYMRASRKRPLRTYEDGSGQFQKLGYEGEWTPTVLLENEATKVHTFSPPPVPTSGKDGSVMLKATWVESEKPLVEGVSHWLRYLDLANAVKISRPHGDKRGVEVCIQATGTPFHNITEVGYGISQVLPILTAGLLQAPDSLLIVDLPEAHLHPLPQARLADFFCAMVMAGRNILIETHSEVFFHWLRLRAELSADLADKIAVYFLNRPVNACCSKPLAVGLTGNAQLRWPIGFFEEAWNIEASIRLVRDARGFHS
jgi:hypothetical protein